MSFKHSNFLELQFVSLVFRELTQREYLVPLSTDLRSLYEDEEMVHSLHCTATESIRPQLTMSEIS